MNRTGLHPDVRLDELFPAEGDIERLAKTDHPKHALIQQCVNSLKDSANGQSAVAFFVPGRVEVLGKHTDYCGGRSLLCAIDKGFGVIARRRDDQLVRVTDAITAESVEFALSHDAHSRTGHWSNYPTTVGRRLARNFGSELQGAEIVFASDLPAAAGLSSSSAMVVGMFLALASLNRLCDRREFRGSIRSLEELAHYCGCIENGSSYQNLAGDAGVGTHGGSQDHTAILCCRANHLSQYGFAPVKLERDIVFPGDVRMFVLSSGVIAEKTGSALERYNAVSGKARHLVQLWNSAGNPAHGSLAAIVRSGPDAVRDLHGLIDVSVDGPFSRTDLRSRLDQFVDESETIIPAASDALASGRLNDFGHCVERSTADAINKLRNQVPETITLVESAMAAGAIACSPFGAGFGGSVWAMVPRERAASFAARDGVMEVVPSDGCRAIR